MPSPPTPTSLGHLIKQLLDEKQKHLDAIAVIDAAFEESGIAPTSRRKGKRRKKAARKKAVKKRAHNKAKKTRRSFRKTGEQFVVDLLKGGKTLTTALINSRWKQARRGHTADNTLSKLTKERKIRRQGIKGERGSTYKLA